MRTEGARHWIERAAASTAQLVFAQVLSKALSLVCLIWLARYLGEVGFGILSFATAYWMVCTSIVEGGTGAFIVREVARDRSRAGYFLGAQVFYKTLLSMVLLGATALFGPQMKWLSNPVKLRVVLLIGVGLALSQIVWYSAIVIFRAHEQFDLEARASVVSGLCVSFATLGCLIVKTSLVTLALALAIAYAVGSLYAAKLYAGRIGDFRVRLSPAAAWNLLRWSLPFAAAYICGNVLFKIDAILLSAISGDEALGIYAASTKLSEQGMFIVAALLTPLYPVLASAPLNQKYRNSLVASKVMKGVIIVALPAVLLTCFWSSGLTRVLYGGRYGATATILPIMLAWFFIWTMKTVTVVLLQANNQERFVARQAVIGLAVNIALNLALIPRWSFVGAAVACIVSEVVMLGHGLRLIRRTKIRHEMARSIRGALLATVVMTSLMVLGNVWMRQVTMRLAWDVSSVLIYVAALRARGYLDAWDRAALARCVRIVRNKINVPMRRAA